MGDAYDEQPAWLEGDADAPSREFVELSKLSLDAILDGEESVPASWVEEELEELPKTRAHVLDPISLAILGATLIGITLASRVKKVGNTDFYEGVPKETVEIAKAATGVVVPTGP